MDLYITYSATAVLDVKAPQKHAQDLSSGSSSLCGDNNIEQKVELADVQSGFGMM